MAFMDMYNYKGVKVHKFKPGHNEGIGVKFSVLFASNTSVSNHTVNQHLMHKIDGEGYLIETTFKVYLGIRGKVTAS